MLGLILKENSFQFNEENFLQKHGTAMGAKMEVSFANIFMAEIETKLIQWCETKLREWKRYTDDVFSLWDCDRKEVDRFIKRANYFHPTIKFWPKYQRSKSFSSIPQCLKGKDSQKILFWTSIPITSRPRPSNLPTSPPSPENTQMK